MTAEIPSNLRYGQQVRETFGLAKDILSDPQLSPGVKRFAVALTVYKLVVSPCRAAINARRKPNGFRHACTPFVLRALKETNDIGKAIGLLGIRCGLVGQMPNMPDEQLSTVVLAGHCASPNFVDQLSTDQFRSCIEHGLLGRLAKMAEMAKGGEHFP
ncbi:hypothetical protein FJZ40_02860 [Candidatus Shapirobacteria bacterium]|nr:hypothetical protein [Candidatus Shapirobacteria bacterium]